MPTTKLAAEDFTDGKIGILDLMMKAELTASKGEGRRLVQQGGVSVNDQKVPDPTTMYCADDFQADFILKKGKKVYHKFQIA